MQLIIAGKPSVEVGERHKAYFLLMENLECGLCANTGPAYGNISRKGFALLLSNLH